MLVEHPLAARDKNPLFHRKEKDLSDIQNDPSTIINQFRLNNGYTIYAICPKRIYKPIILHGSSASEYLMHCTFRGV